MKKGIIILTSLIFLLLILKTGYSKAVNNKVNEDVLSYYRQYSTNTDPGKYLYLYEGLPTDLKELCILIKKQLIHPSKISDYPELAGKIYDDEKVYSVEDMLGELIKRNPEGLTPKRLPIERLRLSCRFHSLLLASILKSRGIPARLRVGFASYLSPKGSNKRIDHWICEVWDKEKNNWIYVDPDLCMVDFDKEKFELAGDAWLKVKKGSMNPNLYGVSKWWGKEYIKANILHDLSCISNNELIYWEGPTLARKKLTSYTKKELDYLDKISLLLQDVDRNKAGLEKINSDSILTDIEYYPRYQ